MLTISNESAHLSFGIPFTSIAIIASFLQIQPCCAAILHSRAFTLPKRQDMGIRYYYKNGKTGFQTSGGCHLTKACWEEAWLLNDTDRALVRDSKGYALLRIRSGRYGLVDFEGRTVIPSRYDVLTNHHAQFNIIGRRGRYGLLNRQGGWAQPLRYDVILPVNQRGNDRLACIRRHKVVFL